VLAVGEEESKMLSARLCAALAILQFGLAMFENKTAHQSIDVYFHADFAGASQRVFCLDLFGCLPLVIAPAKQFSRPYPRCGGDDGVRSALGFLIGIRIFGFSIWVVSDSTGKSLAATRVFRWSTVFPIGCAMLAVNCT
jgi:hypothetical protein